MNREAIIATLTLLGWEPQMTILLNVTRGLQVGQYAQRVLPAFDTRPFSPADGWGNFGTTVLQELLTAIQAYDHEP